jgi:hypothetical protein
MGHREVRRVPLDFEYGELKKVWPGLLMPEELRPDPCPECGPPTGLTSGGYGDAPDGTPYGDGLTPEARAIDRTFYPTSIAYSWNGREMERAKALAWGDKIGQAEVDALIAEGRLRELKQVPEAEQCLEPCEGDGVPEGAVWRGEPCRRFKGHDGGHHPRPSEWVTVPRTAAEVNAMQHREDGSMAMDAHDGINRHILIRTRCKLLGLTRECPRCEGHGTVFRDDAHKAAYDAWEPQEIPTGEGWQIWSTTSEGSPITPVFETPEECARYASLNCTPFASIKWSYDQWLEWITDGHPVDTLLVTRGGEVVSP